MSDISQLGIGLGRLYESLQDGVTITCETGNTIESVRNMVQKSAVNAPIAANRSAFSTITITGVASVGTFSQINVSGVNQLAAPVSVLTAVPATEATRLAAAINGFAPGAGLNFEAFAIGAVVYLIEPQTGAGQTNGVLPVVVVTDASITTTVVAFQDGASPAGTYDIQFGRKYWLNAAFDAPPDSLVGALEITKYITKRGAETGMPTLAITVSSDRLATVDRYSFATHIKADTEGAAATDYLVFINPTGFVEGDLLLIAGTSGVRVITVVSQPNASAVSATPNPNIYLSNNINFSTGSATGATLLLKYTFDTTLGAIFVEVSRSIGGGSGSCITLRTKAQIDTLVAANGIGVGCKYMITDRADAGIIIAGATTNSLELEAEGIFYNADYQGAGDYSGVAGFGGPVGIWYAGMGIPVAGDVAIYNNEHYVNNTGAIGGAPSGDAVNWTVLAKSITTGYIRVSDPIEYDYVNDWIQMRTQVRGDVVKAAFLGSLTTLTDFQWGNDLATGNYLNETVCTNLTNNRGSFTQNYGDGGIMEPDISGSFDFNSNTAVNGGTVRANGADITGAIASANGAVASADYAKALGVNSVASAAQAVAYLQDSEADQHGHAIGYQSVAGVQGVATGPLAEATGVDSLATGYNSRATHLSSMAFSRSAKAQAEHAIAFGISAEANAVASMTLGSGFINIIDNSIGHGWFSTQGWLHATLFADTSGVAAVKMLTNNVAAMTFGDGKLNLWPNGVWKFNLELSVKNLATGKIAALDVRGIFKVVAGVVTYLGTPLYLDGTGVYGAVLAYFYQDVGFAPTIAFTSAASEMIVNVTAPSVDNTYWVGRLVATQLVG